MVELKTKIISANSSDKGSFLVHEIIANPKNPKFIGLLGEPKEGGPILNQFSAKVNGKVAQVYGGIKPVLNKKTSDGKPLFALAVANVTKDDFKVGDLIVFFYDSKLAYGEMRPRQYV